MSIRRRGPLSADFAKAKGAAPFVSRGRQKESVDQRAFVKSLNQLGIGFFYRVKNMGTFDPTRRVYRKHGNLVAIPDICGYLKSGTAVFIEVKYLAEVEKKKKLLFSVKITDEQKIFLANAHAAGCRSGVAYTLEDCLAIATDDPVRYPRHPRTYAFMPKPWLESYAETYAARRHELANKNRDPLTRDITLGVTERGLNWDEF